MVNVIDAAGVDSFSVKEVVKKLQCFGLRGFQFSTFEVKMNGLQP